MTKEPVGFNTQPLAKDKRFAIVHKGTLIDRFLIGEAAPEAVRTLYSLMVDKTVASGVRVQAANSILDRAGYTSKRHEARPEDEVDAHAANITQLRAMIAKLEAEIIDVTPVVEPDSVPATSQELDSYT